MANTALALALLAEVPVLLTSHAALRAASDPVRVRGQHPFVK